ncbi:hypothetical protein E2C01_044040 [Portunus trituberculatus]|uniref:Uncharacterized protein n=1 Tax=Portunus trituberculatus TaxID=210409 RepID=A0A5B7FXR8_PORTR|nr:hypothetical protein [Portunus trituberculatus]
MKRWFNQEIFMILRLNWMTRDMETGQHQHSSFPKNSINVDMETSVKPSPCKTTTR